MGGLYQISQKAKLLFYMKILHASYLEEGDVISIPRADQGRMDAIFKSFSLTSHNIYCTVDKDKKCFYVAEVSISKDLFENIKKRINEKGLDR